MFMIGFLIKLTVFVFSGFLVHVACNDSLEECFDVESKTICYFMPIVSSVKWGTAWKTCKELNATLPVILNEKGQRVLDNYLSQHSVVQPVWTAGRYFRNSEWKWLNNQTIRLMDEPKCRQPGSRNNKSNCIDQTQAVLTKKLEYEARYPNNTYNYICSFPDVNCTTESPKSITWKGGCLSWTTNHRLRLNKARNECLKGGGDLVTFSEDGDLQNLQNLSSVMQDADARGYLIGLHRNWWIWNTTGVPVHDIKFNLLDDYGDSGGDCLFILVIGELSTWSRDKCSENKKFICQTETRKFISAVASFTVSVAIGIAVAILVVAITAVILLIFIRKRPRLLHSVAVTRPDAGTSVYTLDPVTPSQTAIDEYQDDTYATIDLDYDLENLSDANGPNSGTSYTKVEFCDKPLSVYSEPADCDASEANRSTDVYSEPYSSSAVMTPLPKNSVDQPSYVNAAVIKSQKQRRSNDLATPPIKIGPKGDVYTLPISHN